MAAIFITSASSTPAGTVTFRDAKSPAASFSISRSTPVISNQPLCCMFSEPPLSPSMSMK